MSIYKKAAEQKIVFKTALGNLKVEDLFDLPLEGKDGEVTLDALAIALDKQIKEQGTTSFVNKDKKPNALLQLKFDIVLDVIETLTERRKSAEQAAANKQELERLLAIIAQREDQERAAIPLEELRERVKVLGGGN